ncbi:hypothetical protein [Lysinibacillus sp. FSL K6-3209]|uniref:hypothetical protein n=1 Tax=Lysinibacillus sp. FSL K6-3209 TaxID=2921497 RepID=UPI0030DC624D
MQKFSLVLMLLVVLISGCKSALDYTDEDLNDYINNLEHLSFKEGEDISSMDYGTLSLVPNDSFLDLPLSEQYSYIMKVYNKLLDIHVMFTELEVGLPDNDHLTYSIDALYDFQIHAIGEVITEDTDVALLDNFDEKEVWNGTMNGKTAEELLAEEEKVSESDDSTPSTTSSEKVVSSSNDGYEWVTLSNSEKSAKISTIFYNLKSNGYTLLESEAFFIDALDSFYTDSTTMTTTVNDAFVMVSAMAGAMIAP